MKRPLVFTLLATLLLITIAPAIAQDDGNNGPRRADFMNVPFVPDGDDEQVVDIYLPTVGEAPHPTIVMYHGGSFAEGSRFGFRRMALYLADRGYVVINHEYRTSRNYITPVQQFDALCGMGFIHANADTYGIDTERIFTWGESLGGYYSGMASYADALPEWTEGCPHNIPEPEDRTAGMISIYGTVDIWNEAWSVERLTYNAILMGLITMEQAENGEFDLDEMLSAEENRRHNPLYWVDDRDDVPALFLHHRDDANVSINLSYTFANALVENGVDASVITFADQFFSPYHGFVEHGEPQSVTSQTALAYIFAFLTTQGAEPQTPIQ